MWHSSADRIGRVPVLNKSNPLASSVMARPHDQDRYIPNANPNELK